MSQRKPKPASNQTGNTRGADAGPVAENPLRQIPSVEEILNRPGVRELAASAGRRFVTQKVRQVLAGVREQMQRGDIPGQDLEPHIERSLRAAVERGLAFSLRPVINATGVILHTNLGRAPLSRESLDHLVEVATQYSNLEFDIAEGRRGERDVHVSRQFEDLLGAPGIAVNNNAAAVFLTLNTLAEGGEVIVSRGELIEIGGSFRIPDIMQKSGAVLREVGTTNRTRIRDYEAAITGNTKLLLRVHPSNFRIVGFTERPTLEEMVALGKKSGLPVYEDLGSGCLVPRSMLGTLDEAPVSESLAAGVDVVSFSGDKLLGGPQAGLIAGKKDLVARIRRNPLFRALRVDKMTYAVLESMLQAYRQEQFERVPTWRMIRMTAAEVEKRALRLIEACALPRSSPVRLEIVDGESVIGGGSAPGETIPTRLIALHHSRSSAATITAKLLAYQPAVVARSESDRVLFDLRTVFPEQERVLIEALREIAISAP